MILLANLVGGLGNQMFQYACGRALSLRLKVPLKLVVDMFEEYKSHQGFELERVFGLKTPIASGQELSGLLGWRSHVWSRRLIARLRWPFLMPESFVAEPSFRFHPSVLDAAAPLYLHGYWQSSAYFEDCAATIRTDFTFAERLDEANQRFAREMRGVPSVSVHVRRGDYVNNPKGRSVYAECTRQYYSVAMNRMLSIHPGAHFFAFSDDPAWVRDKLCPEFRQMDIIEHNRDRKSYLDMRLMSSCRHHIIANSTFSWWGAWLNPDPDKMVIAPTRWFATSIDSKDLIPDTWICV